MIGKMIMFGLGEIADVVGKAELWALEDELRPRLGPPSELAQSVVLMMTEGKGWPALEEPPDLPHRNATVAELQRYQETQTRSMRTLESQERLRERTAASLMWIGQQVTEMIQALPIGTTQAFQRAGGVFYDGAGVYYDDSVVFGVEAARQWYAQGLGGLVKAMGAGLAMWFYCRWVRSGGSLVNVIQQAAVLLAAPPRVLIPLVRTRVVKPLQRVLAKGYSFAQIDLALRSMLVAALRRYSHEYDGDERDEDVDHAAQILSQPTDLSSVIVCDPLLNFFLTPFSLLSLRVSLIDSRATATRGRRCPYPTTRSHTSGSRG